MSGLYPGGGYPGGWGAYPRNFAIVGAVTVTATPTATLARNHHRSIVGAVATAATPSAALDFTRHAGIVGAIVVTATPAAVCAVTRHRSIVGAVVVTATPAAVLDFTRHAAIVGAVAVTTVPSATLDYTRHAAIVGAVTVTATPVAVLEHFSVGHHHILGAVTVTVTPNATLARTQYVVPTTGGGGGGWSGSSWPGSWSRSRPRAPVSKVARSRAISARVARRHAIVGSVTTTVTPQAEIAYRRVIVPVAAYAPSPPHVTVSQEAVSHHFHDVTWFAVATIPSADMTYTLHPVHGFVVAAKLNNVLLFRVALSPVKTWKVS